MTPHESPFYLLYGRDARIPSESVLSQTVSPYLVDSADYRHELTDSLTTAWMLATEFIKGAQKQQKQAYDKGAKEHKFKVGDRVMIHMPAAVSGKSWKLARPYHGPYRVIGTTSTNIEARLVDDVDADSIFVAVNRVRPCCPSQPDTRWTGPRRRRRQTKRPQTVSNGGGGEPVTLVGGPMTRSRSSRAS